jgi:hypothetical protein
MKEAVAMKRNRMKQLLALSLCWAVWPAAWAAPSPRARISGEASWFVNLDADKFKTNQLGQFLLGELDKGPMKDQLAAFTAIINFDPTKKLKGATLYGWGEKPEDAVLLVQGEFDVERLVTLVKALKDYTNQTHRTYTIHTFGDESQKPVAGGAEDAAGAMNPFALGASIGQGRHSAAIHPGGTLVMGQKAERVGAALDVLDGLKPTLESAKQLPSSPAVASAFFVATAGPTVLSQYATNNAILKVFKSVVFCAGETDDNFVLDLSVETDNEDNAKNVLAMMQGFLATAAMQGGDRGPQAKLLEGLTTSQKDSTLTATLKVSMNDLIQMIKAGPGRAMGARRGGGGQPQPKQR